MKKLLLASSILAGTASIAAAEITLSGDARMGFKNDIVLGGLVQDDDTGFTSRARVKFTFSGETDGGLTFGASFRADNASAASGGTAGEVFISGAFGKLSMGDVDGAALQAVGHVDGVGLTGLGDRNELRFLANGGLSDNDLNDFDLLGANNPTLTGDPTAVYAYTTGNIGLFVSVTDPGFDTVIGATPIDGLAWSIGANYTTDAYKFGIGYEDLSLDEQGGPNSIDATHLILGADGTFGAFTGKVRWGTAEIDSNGTNVVDYDQWSVSGTYTADALAVTAFYSDKAFDAASGPNLIDTATWGLGASYDLGGGAKIVGGVVDVDQSTEFSGTPPFGVGSDTAYDLGVSFSF